MKEITVFQCDHCYKKYASKYRTRDHEKVCWRNPDVKACNTCHWNYYEGRERKCDAFPEIHKFPGTYPKYPVTDCPFWEPSYEYKEEEVYEPVEDI